MVRKLLHDCKRVLRVARKPGRSEYFTIAKITGLGIILIGFLGFIITILAWVLKGGA